MFTRLSFAGAALALAAALLALPAAPALAAQPAAPVACGPNVDQNDIAGTYVSSALQMRLDVPPCAAVILQWDNAYGHHRTYYQTVSREVSGGFVARSDPSSTVTLDDRLNIGFSPAEPGWVTVFTVSMYGDDLRVYRLQKVT